MATAEKVATRTDPAKAVEGLVDTLASSRWASAAAIVIVALVCFLPGLNTLPPLDSDETRFAETARQMARAGDYVDTRLQGVETAYLRRLAPIGSKAAAIESLHRARPRPVLALSAAARSSPRSRRRS